MSRALDKARLDLLILCRLAAPTKRPLSDAEIERQLHAFVEPLLSRPEWRQTLQQQLDALRSAGLLEGSRLTEPGRQRVREALGRDKIPAWRTMRETLLPALALGLSPESPRVKKRLGDADGLRASVLSRAHELPTGELPTLTRAIDALVWRELGVETDRPVTAAGIRAHFLQELVGRSSRLKAEKLAALLAARASSAPSPDARVLRLSVVRSWLTETEGAAPAAKEPAAAMDVGSDPLKTRSRRIHEVARTLRDGRFGDRKVFIAAAWRALRGDPLFDDMDLEGFKRLLVRANHAGYLTLHRADLVGAMDEGELRESETSYLNATFHFIESELESSGRSRDETRRML